MKERYALVRRTHPERQIIVASGRWYRSIGRVCLLAAAAASSVEIFYAWQSVPLPPVTLRSILELSSAAAAPGIAPHQAVIELLVDSPLWILLIALAAIPYGLAVGRFLRTV
jgi:hypothetical protein